MERGWITTVRLEWDGPKKIQEKEKDYTAVRLEWDGPHLFIVASAGAGISTGAGSHAHLRDVRQRLLQPANAPPPDLRSLPPDLASPPPDP
jgi:hypothetical protein